MAIESGFNGDVLEAMDHIFKYMWTAYPPQLKPEFKEHIEKYRSVVPRAVSKFQLYSLFIDRQSRVDYELDRLLRANSLKRLVASDDEFFIKTEDYVDCVNDALVEAHSCAATVSLLERFREWIQRSNESVSISKQAMDFTPDEMVELTTMEFFSIIPRECDKLNLSVPKLGLVITLQQLSTTFVLRSLNACKWREMRVLDLNNKWNKNKSRFNKLKGLSLRWCLHNLAGRGTVEVFRTATSDDRAIRIVL